jgi:hypothetical protein
MLMSEFIGMDIENQAVDTKLAAQLPQRAK